MWCPEGYVTLNSILTQLVWDSDLMEASIDRDWNADDENELSNRAYIIEGRAFVKWLHSALFDLLAEEFRVCLASGLTVKLDPEAYSWRDSLEFSEYLRAERHRFPKKYQERVMLAKREFAVIDISTGCISADLEQDGRRLEPIMGMPLCIREASIPVKIENLTKWLIDEMERRASAEEHEWKRAVLPEGGAGAIVQAFRSGKVKTKSDAKRMFARDMKHEAWLALWREVVSIAPELSRPGPR